MNFKEIEKEIEKKCEKAMVEVAEWGSEQAVYAIDDFYSSYSPKFYERHGQLYKTVGRYPSVYGKGNGLETYVYFFPDELDYSKKSFTRWHDGSVYHNPFNWKHTSSDGWFDNKGYDSDLTFETAFYGDAPHGGHGNVSGNIFINLWKRLYKDYEWQVGYELRRAGLPIKW